MNRSVTTVLRDVERAWNAAADAWDVEALSACYTEDALFFGGRPGHAIGRDAVAAYFSSYSHMIASGAVALRDQEIRLLGPSAFIAQGFGSFQFRLVDGSTATAELRTTLVLVLNNHVWLIQQHHFSATPAAPPIDVSEAKES